MAHRGEGMNGTARLPDLLEKLEALLDNVKIERHVFQHLSNAMRDVNGVQLSGVVAELALLQTMLEEFIKELGEG